MIEQIKKIFDDSRASFLEKQRATDEAKTRVNFYKHKLMQWDDAHSYDSVENPFVMPFRKACYELKQLTKGTSK